MGEGRQKDREGQQKDGKRYEKESRRVVEVAVGVRGLVETHLGAVKLLRDRLCLQGVVVSRSSRSRSS